MTIFDYIDTLAPSITDIAHQIHRNPELSGQEFQTTALLRNKLEAAGIELPDVSLKTGLIALIRGKKPGNTVALRSDIDALPINEDLSHQIRSQQNNIMHACGHDIHAAALYGTALALQAYQDKIPGNILLIFQPSEENSQGARSVIKSGIFDRYIPDAFFSFHVWPDYPIGTVAITSGPLMAAQHFFSIKIKGKGGHASAPHTTHDPIVPAAKIVDALQSISARRYDPLKPFVLSVCSIHSGTAHNIIPNTAELGGTCRFLDADMDNMIKHWITQICKKTSEAYECQAEVEFFNEIPPVVNDIMLSEIAWQAAERIYGKGNTIKAEIKMASEDFGLYADIAPIFMFHAGYSVPFTKTAPLHSSKMFVPDQVPIQAARMLACCVMDYINKSSRN